ncbi:MAG: hypothetical protein ACYDBB_23675 [Armatimonadota bacterium]
MKMRFTLVLVIGMLLLGVTAPSFAQNAPTNVSGLTPFSAQTHFMSLSGYLRWQYFKENNTWLSAEEAQALVDAQIKPATN